MHKASVICVRFDPLSSRVVASASADGFVYISTAYEASLDTSGSGPFANIQNDDVEILYKFNTNSWNNVLSFSPDAATLVFACK